MLGYDRTVAGVLERKRAEWLARKADLETQLAMLESGKLRTGSTEPRGRVDTTAATTARVKAWIVELERLLAEYSAVPAI
jgi:hypothetical protein